MTEAEMHAHTENDDQAAAKLIALIGGAKSDGNRLFLYDRETGLWVEEAMKKKDRLELFYYQNLYKEYLCKGKYNSVQNTWTKTAVSYGTRASLQHTLYRFVRIQSYDPEWFVRMTEESRLTGTPFLGRRISYYPSHVVPI